MIVVEPVPADDPRVVPIIEAHVGLMDATTADPDACHRLDLSGLLAPHITFFGAFDRGTAIGIGAYAHFGEWGEVKSMHVLAAARGNGVARRILDAIEARARELSADVIRLETGAAFDAAIALYRSAGFTPCGAFGGYPDHPLSRFFEKTLSVVSTSSTTGRKR
ncbi:MAG TPA: GNAT family N-acetyltransferase [Ilumatobacter sp.]|nr:GNAT family N-acetyltransferase [Ilumatobacter sp.]